MHSLSVSFMPWMVLGSVMTEKSSCVIWSFFCICWVPFCRGHGEKAVIGWHWFHANRRGPEGFRVP